MDNRKLTFQELQEYRERFERIKSRSNEGSYDYLQEGDHAIYYIDFKNRVLTDKITIEIKSDINLYKYLNK